MLSVSLDSRSGTKSERMESNLRYKKAFLPKVGKDLYKKAFDKNSLKETRTCPVDDLKCGLSLGLPAVVFFLMIGLIYWFCRYALSLAGSPFSSLLSIDNRKF